MISFFFALFQAVALLDASRIAKLPADQQAAWQSYITRSDSMRLYDRMVLAAELKASGKAEWTPAPTNPGFFMQDSMTTVWFATPAARQLADYIVSYQAPNGGWSKRMAFDHVRAAGEAYTSDDNATWFSTLDNGATTEQLQFLSKIVGPAPEARYKNALVRGVNYLLAAQEPNGCWPQIFPLAGSYHDAITFNDDVTVDALNVLTLVSEGQLGFVPVDIRKRATDAINAGVNCIIQTQVEVKGVKTVWGQQHDPLTLQPVKARAYEHPSLSSRESAGVLNYLMSIKKPTPEVETAVHAGVAWLKANAIYGYEYHFKKDLEKKEGAGPIWSRFYEIPSYRPMFSGRDGIIKYNLSEIEPERRYNYGWYTDEATRTLKRYEKWSKTHGKP